MKDDYFREWEKDNCTQEGHRLDAKDYLKMKRQLIIGHNGLRNRIAGIMHVANMMELVCECILNMSYLWHLFFAIILFS